MPGISNCHKFPDAPHSFESIIKLSPECLLPIITLCAPQIPNKFMFPDTSLEYAVTTGRLMQNLGKARGRNSVLGVSIIVNRECPYHIYTTGPSVMGMERVKVTVLYAIR